MIKRSVPALLACLIAACGDASVPTEPVSGLEHAVATNSCGPADGPAVAIYLAAQPVESLQPVAPYVQVQIGESFTALAAGSVYQVSDFFMEANAWFHGSGVEMKIANDGEVGVTTKSSTALTGYVDLRFPDGLRFRGTFSANWEPRQVLCG
jgi:hypothetical protein